MYSKSVLNLVYPAYLSRAIAIMILPFLLAAACATTAEVAEAPEPEVEEAESVLDQTIADAIDIDMYRSRLSDHYSSVENEIPDAFKISENEMQERTENSGYRIQLVSTNDRVLADSLALSFDMWADTADVPRRPMSYIQFRQPAYRVHVGDFLSRRVAIEYLGVIRRFFPGAWVVHDRIEINSLIE